MNIPTNLKPYYFAFVSQGPRWRDPASREARELMSQHLLWVRRMNDEGKLQLAGPLSGEGSLIAVGVLSVTSEDEARQVVASDPQAIARNFAYEVRPVLLPDLETVRFEYSE